MIHTFEYHPIETAPKGRVIALFCPKRGRWITGKWDDQRYHSKPNPYWKTWEAHVHVTEERADQPTFWAEITDMAPVPSPVLSDQLDSTPLTVEEKIGPRWTTDGEYYMPDDTPAAVAFSRGWIMRGETERGEDGSAECLEEAWDRTYDELAALPSPIRKAQGDDQKEERDA